MLTSSSTSPPSEITSSTDYEIVSDEDSAEEQEEEEGWELLDPLSPQVPSVEVFSTDQDVDNNIESWQLLDIITNDQAPAVEVSLASVEVFSNDELIDGDTWELLEFPISHDNQQVDQLPATQFPHSLSPSPSMQVASLFGEGGEGDGAPAKPVMLAYKSMAITTQVYGSLLGYINSQKPTSTAASTTAEYMLYVVVGSIMLGFFGSICGVLLAGKKPLASWIMEWIGSVATTFGFLLAMGLLLPENLMWISMLSCVFSLPFFAASVIN